MALHVNSYEDMKIRDPFPTKSGPQIKVECVESVISDHTEEAPLSPLVQNRPTSHPMSNFSSQVDLEMGTAAIKDFRNT